MLYSDGYRLTVPLRGQGSGGGGLKVKLALGRFVDGCGGLGSAVEEDLRRDS